MNPEASTDNGLEQELEKQAIAYVHNVRAFHMNWIAFLVVMPVLYFLNERLSPAFSWYSIVGWCWAAAVVLHALIIFGMFSLFGGAWEQRTFQRRMEKSRGL